MNPYQSQKRVSRRAVLRSTNREEELRRREERLWTRMESLLDREEALRERERRAHAEREAALQAQVDQLLAFVGRDYPEKRLPPAPENLRLRRLAQELEHTASNDPHGTFDEVDGARGAAIAAEADAAVASGASASEAVANAMRAVRDGADILEDIDLTVPRRAPPPSGAAAAAPSTSGHSSDAHDDVPRRPRTPPPSSHSAPAAPRQGSDEQPAPPPPPPAAAAAAAADTPAYDGPVEVPKAPRDGPPPRLSTGDDDIFWVAALQKALMAAGFYCGEDEDDAFFFGPGTASALMTYQACNGLSETGIADEATWAALGVGAGGRTAEDDSPAAPATPSGSNGASAGQSSSFGGLFDGLLTVRSGATAGGAAASTAPGSAASDAPPQYTKWPILREGDGERAVHTLQIKLREHGFHPDDDDSKWWMFGASTLSAVSTFQACNGLPESGVCCEATWAVLMGEGARPEHICRVFSGDSDDEDLEQQGEGCVYLMGEQRWSRPLVQK